MSTIIYVCMYIHIYIHTNTHIYNNLSHLILKDYSEGKNVLSNKIRKLKYAKNLTKLMSIKLQL